MEEEDSGFIYLAEAFPIMCFKFVAHAMIIVDRIEVEGNKHVIRCICKGKANGDTCGS